VSGPGAAQAPGFQSPVVSGFHAPATWRVATFSRSHFHWAKSGEYVSQVTAIGPLGLEYLNPDDDPRNG
jgi:hypothetical protein